MLLRRFYDTKLAQAAYLVGCQRTGEALVVDPNRDVAPLIEAARSEGLRICHVTETHIHADYVSGSRELARRAGARLYLSAEGGPDWQYGFAAADGAVLLRDHDVFKVGNVRVEALHTPGHTPEHLSFMITDGATTDRAMGVFTGDFVFVGDVGRPDLLERAAGIAGTMEAGARTLFRSIQALKPLPDWLQLWPAHGAGSACGKALGAVPSTTLGYERFANWGFTTENEEEFVRTVLAGQPEPPGYFAHMKRINRDGPPASGSPPVPPRLDPRLLAGLLDEGATVVDLRGTMKFARSHVAGTISVPLGQSFTTYAGSVLPFGRDVYLLADEERLAGVNEAARDLALIGFETKGCFGPDALETPLAGRATAQLAPEALVPRLESGEVTLVDVRARSEYEEGHIPGAVHMALPVLPERLGELPRERPLVLQCETGSRSSVAASLLKARGFTRVENLTGGFLAWQRAGLPVVRETAEAVAGS